INGLYFAGNVSGPGLLNVTGTGPLFLTSPNNTYSGGTFVNLTTQGAAQNAPAATGVLVVGSNDPGAASGSYLGSGTVTLQQGAIQSNSLVNTTITNNVVLPGGVTVTVGGSKTLTFSNLNVLGSNTLNISSTATTAVTNVGGPGALTVSSNVIPGPLT